MLKKVYTASTPLMPGFIQEVLENAGIPCVQKNYFLNGAMGELPFVETWPAIWVDEKHEHAALDLIKATLEGRSSQLSWICGQCGENLEAQFQSCWQCGQAAPNH
jgi:rubrerythrin